MMTEAEAINAGWADYVHSTRPKILSWDVEMLDYEMMARVTARFSDGSVRQQGFDPRISHSAAALQKLAESTE